MTVLGVGQANFRVGKLEHNLGVIDSLLVEAERARVEILVLPELANSGYALQDAADGQACAESLPQGPVCRRLAQWTRPGRVAVCGLCELEGGRLFNSAVIFGGGEWLGTYRKAHLFMKEPQIFSPGEAEPPVIEFGGHKLGVLICYDWAFPEMARLLALQGAQLLLHPSNLVLPFGQQAMRVRSIENRVFTATANRFGLERGIPFSGNSQIISPTGDILAQASGDFSGVITAEVDLAQADDKMITPFNHLFEDRKPELYRRISAPKG
jgi:beta-ureidopropionase